MAKLTSANDAVYASAEALYVVIGNDNPNHPCAITRVNHAGFHVTPKLTGFEWRFLLQLSSVDR